MPFLDATEDTVYKPLYQDITIEFAERFSELNGRFSYVETMTDLIRELKTLIEKRKWSKIFCVENQLKCRLETHGLGSGFTGSLATSDASITGCEYLIARTGSFLLSSKQQAGRTATIYSPVHICVAHTSQLVYDISDGLLGIKQKYGGAIPSMISLASGPSRTADIEKTLVTGVHGPKEVFCLLTDDDALK